MTPDQHPLPPSSLAYFLRDAPEELEDSERIQGLLHFGYVSRHLPVLLRRLLKSETEILEFFGWFLPRPAEHTIFIVNNFQQTTLLHWTYRIETCVWWGQGQ